MQRNRSRETEARAVARTVKIAGQRFVLRPNDVVQALRSLDPEPIASHYVVVGKRRYPPKQAIGAVTGLDRADFTTHQARRTLMGLGFPVGRRDRDAMTSMRGVPVQRHESPADAAEQLVDRLRPLVGQWVAIKDDDVLHADASPHALVAWLARHRQQADSVFRVPDDEVAASGLAPL